MIIIVGGILFSPGYGLAGKKVSTRLPSALSL
jgi:hypothetical protein